MASPFSPETREATLAALPAAALDVLVIGGGITGAGVAREAAMERSVLRRLAPHLALPVRLLMPTYGRAGHAKLGLGLWTFERIATVAAEERHAMWSREEALEREPTLDGA